MFFLFIPITPADDERNFLHFSLLAWLKDDEVDSAFC